MKPYNVELFDRNFNFRATALIDSTTFTYKYDYLVREKNTIIVPDYIKIRKNATAGSMGDYTVCTGDYIVVRGEDTTAVAYNNAHVVIKTESVKNGIEITYTDPLVLFDHETFIKVDDIKQQGRTIEAYVYYLLRREFIETTDTSQRIPHLYVEMFSYGDTGYFDYTETDEYYTSINLLNDLLLPAFCNYLVKTEITIDVGNKRAIVLCDFNMRSSYSVIEGDLPNIIHSDYILKQSGDEINKVTLIDLAEENKEYNYYLHASDYSYSSVDTDRITPVKNEIRVVDSDNITEEEFWYKEDRALETIQKYAQYDGNLTNSQISELQGAFGTVYPYIKDMVDPTLTAQWYKDNVGFDELEESISVFHYPIYDFSLYDHYGIPMWGTYKDIAWNDTDELKGGSYYTFRVSKKKSSLAQSDFEFRTQYKGLLPEDADITTPSDHISRFVMADEASPDEVKSVVTYAEEILWWRKDGYKIAYYRFDEISPDTWRVTAYRFMQTVNSDFSHIHLKLPYTVDLRGNKYDSDQETDNINSYYNIRGYINIPVTYSWIKNHIDAYKRTSAYKTAYENYKAAQIDYIMDGYVKKNFVAAKYVHDIEISVSRDDSRVKPLNMKVGDYADIIHNGERYQTMLTGIEQLNNGLIKLIFGTIRVNLTKLLRLNK